MSGRDSRNDVKSDVEWLTGLGEPPPVSDDALRETESETDEDAMSGGLADGGGDPFGELDGLLVLRRLAQEASKPEARFRGLRRRARQNSKHRRLSVPEGHLDLEVHLGKINPAQPEEQLREFHEGSAVSFSTSPEGFATALDRSWSKVERLTGHWPQRTEHDFPQTTLQVEAWWPEVDGWEELTLIVYVSPDVMFEAADFHFLIQHLPDEEPTSSDVVWLFRRTDLGDGTVPTYELRATEESGEDGTHRYRFLVRGSPQLDEVSRLLEVFWHERGIAPTGPEEFDAMPKLKHD